MSTKREVAYVSGPMTGYHGFNFGAFDKAKEVLEEKGYEVVSPADFGEKGTWQENLRRDIRILMAKVDVVFTLPGWHDSRGATLEVFVAAQVGIPVKPFTPVKVLPTLKKLEEE